MTDPDTDALELGRALAALRRRAGLTQADAAEKVGVRNTHISTVERGERGISMRTLMALLRVYGTDLRGLVDEIDRGRV